MAAKVCVCGHSAYWHGAGDGERPAESMGEGGCDSCDCARFDEARTDSYASLRAERDAAEARAVEAAKVAQTIRDAARAYASYLRSEAIAHKTLAGISTAERIENALREVPGA